MFNLDQEVQKLKARGIKNPPSSQKMAFLLASAFDRAASQHAFKIFNDKKFRNLLNFLTLAKIEQDRLFNELVVSAIALIMLTLETPDLKGESELKEYLQFVRDQLPKAHSTELKNLGIEKKFLKQWEQLIDMRYQEYHKDKLEVRAAAMNMEYDDGSAESLEDIQIMLPVNTIAMGAHRHILRGKTEGRDELFKYLIREFGKLYVQIRLPLEGKKITFLDKLLVKMKLFFSKY